MIAIVKVGGHQAIVQPGEQIEVDRINTEAGKSVELEALLISEEDGKNCQIGAPVLDTKIKAKVIEHTRGDKIRVYKMKPRKRYRRTKGHRQDYTVIEIEKFDGTPKTAATKKTTAKKEDKAEPKKTAAKKPTAKKAPAKKVAKKDA